MEINNLPRLNSREDTLLRINYLWKESHEKVMEEKYYFWDLILDRVWLELINLMDEEQFSQLKKQFEEVNEGLYALGGIDDSKNNGFKKKEKKEFVKRTNQYKKLMEKEIFLRKSQSKVEQNKKIT